MYYVKCFLYGKPVAIFGYKTEKSAINRQQKSIDSGCYEKVTIELDMKSKNIFEHGLNCY